MSDIKMILTGGISSSDLLHRKVVVLTRHIRCAIDAYTTFITPDNIQLSKLQLDQSVRVGRGAITNNL